MRATGFRTRVALAVAGLGWLLDPTSTLSASENAPDSWIQVDDQQGLFSVRYPADWKPKVTYGSPDRTWFAGEAGSCKVRLQTDPQASGLSSAEASAQLTREYLAEQIRIELSNAKLLSVSDGTLAGLPAKIFEAEYSQRPPLDGLRFHMLAAWACRSGTAYLLTCSSTADSFAAAEPKFRAVLASFSLPPVGSAGKAGAVPRMNPVEPERRPSVSRSRDAPREAGGAIFLVLYPILSLICAWLAHRKQRNPWLWAGIGPFFFPVALVLLARKALPCPVCGHRRDSACAFCGARIAHSQEEGESDAPLNPEAKWKGMVTFLAPIAQAKGDYAAFASHSAPFWKRTPFRKNRQLPIVGVELDRDTWEVRIRLGGLLRVNPVPSSGISFGELMEQLENLLHKAAHCKLVISDRVEMSRGDAQKELLKSPGHWEGAPQEELPESLLAVFDAPFNSIAVRSDDVRRRVLLTTSR